MTVAHLISFLQARGHQVFLRTLDTGAHADAEHRAWISQNTANAQLYRHGKSKQLLGALKGLLRGLPLQVGLFTSRALRRGVDELVHADAVDLIYVYYFRSAECVSARALKRSPNILAMQLSQSLNTRRIRENAPNWWLRLLYEVESRLVSAYETKVWTRFDRTALIGQADLSALNDEADARGRRRIDNVFFSPHGTDVSRYSPSSDEATTPGLVVFSGVMRTPTNVQAVQWFVKNVWPHVILALPHAQFRIVGREPSAEVTALASEAGHIEVTGTVADPAAHISAAQVCVNPMQAGGGMQNKLIEYLSSGKAIVGTSVANEGIHAPASAMVVADDPVEFADEVVRLLADPGRRKQLGAHARAFVEERWSWESHFFDLEQQFYNVRDRGQAQD